jgi:hypothetical protein
MIVDCFTFADELDMLEHRLTELDEAADFFVLVEASVTFQGNPKPLVYATNRERFARWRDRIVHVVADLPAGPNNWLRENTQREHMMIGLDRLHAADDDIVVIADVDEIWRNLRRPDPLLVFEQTMYVYSFDWVHPDPWPGPVAVTAGLLRRLPESPFTVCRYCRTHDRPERITDGGEHLTWFGGIEATLRKIDSFSHTEPSMLAIRPRLADGSLARDGIHIDGTKLVAA